jgi:hypothetical protein
MSTSDDRSSTPPADPEGIFNDFLTYAELLQAPQLARLYTFILREGPVEVETIKRALEMPHSTTYKYLGRLEEMGLLTRHDDTAPTTVTVDPIRLLLDTEQGVVAATPVLIDAIGRQLDSEDIRVFIDRQGLAKLAAALHYTLRIMDGEFTQRTAASTLGVHAVEGLSVFAALQDVIEAAAEYDPYLDMDGDGGGASTLDPALDTEHSK